MGDLDECNGIDTNTHGYVYLITKEFLSFQDAGKATPTPRFVSLAHVKKCFYNSYLLDNISLAG